MKTIFLIPMLSLSMTLLTLPVLAQPSLKVQTRAVFEVAQTSIVFKTHNGQQTPELQTKMVCERTVEFSAKNLAVLPDCMVPHKGQIKKVYFRIGTGLRTRTFEGVTFTTRSWDSLFMLQSPSTLAGSLIKRTEFQTTDLGQTGFVVDAEPEEYSALLACMSTSDTVEEMKACSDRIGEVYRATAYIK